MVWFLLTLVTLAAFWYFLVKPLSYWKVLGVYHSKSPWLLFGDSWRAINIISGQDALPKYMEWLAKNSRQNGFMGIYDFYTPALCVTDPDLLKIIAVKDFMYFSDRTVESISPEVDPLWGRNLLALQGQEWKDVRSVLSPLYTSSKLKFMLKFILEEVEKFVEALGSMTKEEVTELEINDIFGRFSNDVIASTGFGVKVDSLKDKNNAFYKSAVDVTNFKTARRILIHILILRILPTKASKFLGLKVIDRQDGALLIEAIEQRVKQEQQCPTKRIDMVHLVVEAMKENKKDNSSVTITTEEIIANAFLFLFGGLDSVSFTLSFAAYELAVNQDVQRKLRKEIIESSKKYKELTVEVLQEMRYLDMVISEVLRKWPSFVSTDRMVVKPYTLQTTNKVSIKLNTQNRIVIPIYGIHRNPEYFPNPEKFDPERFSEENKANLNPYVYMPFGVGQRLCLGYRFALLEMKALLYHLLSNFELLPTDKTPKIPQLKSASFQYQLKGGFWVGLRQIKKQ